MNVHKGWAFPRGIYSGINTGNYCIIALTLQPIFPEVHVAGTSVHRLRKSLFRWVNSCKNSLEQEPVALKSYYFGEKWAKFQINKHKRSKVNLSWEISLHVLKISAVPGRHFAYMLGRGVLTNTSHIAMFRIIR